MTARRGSRGVCWIVGAAMAGAGCGVTHLQTARTTPRGQTQTTMAASLLHTSDRGFDLVQGLPIPPVPLEVMVRHGATDRLDWGVRLFLGLGALADVKWNLLSPGSRSALAISTGIGGAYTGSATAHVPATVTASRTLLPWLTPYAAVGYGAYWIFGYGTRNPTQTYAARTWTGDGLLTLHAGVELARASGGAVLLEYTHARPIVRDPGDLFEFAVSDFVSIGFRTGRGPLFAR